MTCPAVKRSEPEHDTAEVKNPWNISSTLPHVFLSVCLGRGTALRDISVNNIDINAEFDNFINCTRDL
jgi:hypothetical protein